MSLRFPDNAAMDHFRNYNNFAEILSPTINRTWEGCSGRSANERTLGEFFTFLKALYTRDNIRNHIAMFFPDVRNWATMDVGGEYSHAFFDRHFASIPEEDLWFLYYARITDMTSRAFYWTVVTIDPTTSLRRVERPYIGMNQSSDTITTTENNTLHSLITGHIDKYRTFFTSHGDRIS